MICKQTVKTKELFVKTAPQKEIKRSCCTSCEIILFCSPGAVENHRKISFRLKPWGQETTCFIRIKGEVVDNTPSLVSVIYLYSLCWVNYDKKPYFKAYQRDDSLKIEIFCVSTLYLGKLTGSLVFGEAIKASCVGKLPFKKKRK